MKQSSDPKRKVLAERGRVAVIGGGPAGSFFAVQLLRRARETGKQVEVTLFERRRGTTVARTDAAECWKGCNYCAGGISPKLNEVLESLGMRLPEEMIQDRIKTLTVQGYWKNIELDVPPGRELCTVYRGSKPESGEDSRHNFDSFLLEHALKSGARLIGGEVLEVRRSRAGNPVVVYGLDKRESSYEADLVVFAAGVNESVGGLPKAGRLAESLRELMPGFEPPRVRHALIFEVEARPSVPLSLRGAVYFVEYGSKSLPLEMCSVVPKRHHVTITLVGRCVDRASTCGEARQIAHQFLRLPHIRKLIPAGVFFTQACSCRPNMVMGSAKHPYSDSAAAIGDLVTSRLYKDGILSAYLTGKALADAVLDHGVDEESLRAGYEPTLRGFRVDNRYAALVFLIHRVLFSSSVLSRVLYQAVIHERKRYLYPQRRLERILWEIASGDDQYRRVFSSMIHPATVWSVLTGGVAITLRNYLTELFFGLRWQDLGRFTTGVALERLEDKRAQFWNLTAEAGVPIPESLEFERMYTIKVNASRELILKELGRFGEPDRGYLRPRWVKIRRIAGQPNTPGCVIQYQIVHPGLTFHLELEQLVDGHLAFYRVRDGFARGGVLIFEIEKLNAETSALSIYVAFNFPRGGHLLRRTFWALFRLLFPAFIHDVLWNHSLCQLKDIVEAAAQSSAMPGRAGEAPVEPRFKESVQPNIA